MSPRARARLVWVPPQVLPRDLVAGLPPAVARELRDRVVPALDNADDPARSDDVLLARAMAEFGRDAEQDENDLAEDGDEQEDDGEHSYRAVYRRLGVSEKTLRYVDRVRVMGRPRSCAIVDLQLDSRVLLFKDDSGSITNQTLQDDVVVISPVARTIGVRFFVSGRAPEVSLPDTPPFDEARLPSLEGMLQIRVQRTIGGGHYLKAAKPHPALSALITTIAAVLDHFASKTKLVVRGDIYEDLLKALDLGDDEGLVRALVEGHPETQGVRLQLPAGASTAAERPAQLAVLDRGELRVLARTREWLRGPENLLDPKVDSRRSRSRESSLQPSNLLSRSYYAEESNEGEKKTEGIDSPESSSREERLLQGINAVLRIPPPQILADPEPAKRDSPRPIAELRRELTLERLRRALDQEREPVVRGIVYRELSLGGWAKIAGFKYPIHLALDWDPRLGEDTYRKHLRAADILEQYEPDLYASTVQALVDAKMLPTLPDASTLTRLPGSLKGLPPDLAAARAKVRLNLFSDGTTLRIADDLERFGNTPDDLRVELRKVDEAHDALLDLPERLLRVIEAADDGRLDRVHLEQRLARVKSAVATFSPLFAEILAGYTTRGRRED